LDWTTNNDDPVERKPNSTDRGVSGSVQDSTTNLNNVFSSSPPTSGRTWKLPGIGDPFVTTSIADELVACEAMELHDRENDKIEFAGRTLAGRTKFAVTVDHDQMRLMGQNQMTIVPRTAPQD